MHRWTQEGLLDSSGSFSLDGQRAFQQLSQFALAGPGHWVLNLVSWAVASGARRLDFRISSAQVDLSFPGPSPRPEELREIFANFAGQGLALQELAIALAAVCRPQNRVEIWTPHGRFTLSPAGFEASPAEVPLPEDQVRLRLRRPISWMRRWATPPEVTCLRSRLQLSTIPVTLNRQALNGMYSLPRIHSGVVLGTRPAFVWLDPEDLAILQHRPSPGEYSALIGHSEVPLLETPTLVLVRGLLFELPPLLGQVVIQADGLRKDLSQAQLLRDRALEEILETARSILHDLRG